jgi:hypothetical protein
VAQRIEFAHHRRWGDVNEAFVAISCDISAGELGKRSMADVTPTHSTNASLLAVGVSWSRLSEQLFRVDKWSVCRG